MNISIRVQKAIKIISGYCEKHDKCCACPLEAFCAEVLYVAPEDWLGCLKQKGAEE